MARFLVREGKLVPINEKKEKVVFSKPCGVKVINGAVAVDDGWDNSNEELNIVSVCGHKPKDPVKITISRVVKNKIDLLMKQYPGTEWLGYLIGNIDTMFINDLTVPKQDVTSTSVHVIGPSNIPGVIGVIHSHHRMGAFFSGTDENYINGNHHISIVVSSSGSKAQIRWITPCGSKTIIDANVVVERENLFNEETFLEDAIENIFEAPMYPGYMGGVYSGVGLMQENAKKPAAVEIKKDVNSVNNWGNPKYSQGNMVGIKGLSVGTDVVPDVPAIVSIPEDTKELSPAIKAALQTDVEMAEVYMSDY